MSESRRFATIPSLDGLRAVSIGLVFAGHVGFELIPGGFGVTVFFVLSGYLITTLMRIEYDRAGAVSLSNFYRRRVFRIWPAFYAVLLVAAVLTLTVGLGGGSVDGLPLLGQVTHVFNYFAVFYHGTQEAMWGTGIYWSLAIEEHFYLMLPLLFVIMNHFGLPYRRQAMVLTALAAAVMAWRCVLVYGFHVSQARTYYSTDTRADSLLLGCALALYRNPVIDEVRESSRAIGGAAIAGVIAILVSLLYRDFEFREAFRYTIQAAALVLIIRYVILAPRSPAGRVLNARLVVWIGQLSYAFYLVHQIVVFEVLKHIDGKVPVAAVSLVASVAVAFALQHAIMNPATRLRQILDARRASRLPTPASTMS
ncbi:MAG: acyltransferase [Acidimicrobiales bacterium]